MSDYRFSYQALQMDKNFRKDVFNIFAHKAYDEYFSKKNGKKIRHWLLTQLITFEKLNKEQQNLITDLVNSHINDILNV